MLCQQKDKRTAERGITLVEILIATVMVGLLGIGVGTLVGAASRQMIQSVSTTNNQNQATYLMQHIHRHLVLATAITEPENVGDSGPQLTFEWRPGLGDLDRTSGYRLQAGAVQWNDDRSTDNDWENLATNVTNMVFERPVRGEVIVTLSIQGPNSQNPTTLRTTVSPRGMPSG